MSRTLAARIEQAQAAGTARAVTDLARSLEDAAYRAEPVQDGWLVLTPPDVPLFGARGLGFEAPVEDDTIDLIERSARGAGVPPRFDVCPLADDTLDERLAVRGYARAPSCEVWTRAVGDGPPASALPPGVEVEPVAPDDAAAVDRFARTVASGYCDGGTPDAWNVAIGRNAASRPGRFAFVARVDGAVAGGGIVGVTDGLASFTFMSTLPSCRRRGVQGALMRARMARAVELGADAICVQCEEGSPTARNAARLGFRRLYTRHLRTKEAVG